MYARHHPLLHDAQAALGPARGGRPGIRRSASAQNGVEMSLPKIFGAIGDVLPRLHAAGAVRLPAGPELAEGPCGHWPAAAFVMATVPVRRSVAPMNPDRPLNLFYEEPDPDRWLPFDRHPRRLIRRLVRGPDQPGGAMRVFLNLRGRPRSTGRGLSRQRLSPHQETIRPSSPASSASRRCWPRSRSRRRSCSARRSTAIPTTILNCPSARPIRQVLVPSAWVQRHVRRGLAGQRDGVAGRHRHRALATGSGRAADHRRADL